MIEAMRIVYLVCADIEHGVKAGQERGWTRIAHNRMVTPERVDVRLVSRINDLVPFAGSTPMMRGPDYDEQPPGRIERQRWCGGDGEEIGERARFERFVADGNGVWVNV